MRLAAKIPTILPNALAQDHCHLGWLAIFYGLDWVATVPLAVKLASDWFGRQKAGVMYGWIGAAHQLSAALEVGGRRAIRTYKSLSERVLDLRDSLSSSSLAFLFTARPLAKRTIRASTEMVKVRELRHEFASLLLFEEQCAVSFILGEQEVDVSQIEEILQIVACKRRQELGCKARLCCSGKLKSIPASYAFSSMIQVTEQFSLHHGNDGLA